MDDTQETCVAFEVVVVDAWTECTTVVKNGVVTATGRCGRCGHWTSRTFGHIVVSEAASPAGSSIPARGPEEILCDCGRSHPGRLEGDFGCGASWLGTKDGP